MGGGHIGTHSNFEIRTIRTAYLLLLFGMSLSFLMHWMHDVVTSSFAYLAHGFTFVCTTIAVFYFTKINNIYPNYTWMKEWRQLKVVLISSLVLGVMLLMYGGYLNM